MRTLLHGGRPNWTWLVLKTSPTLKTKLLDDLKDGLVEAVAWIRQGKSMQPMHEPKPMMDEEEATEGEDTQIGVRGRYTNRREWKMDTQCVKRE